MQTKISNKSVNTFEQKRQKLGRRWRKMEEGSLSKRRWTIWAYAVLQNESQTIKENASFDSYWHMCDKIESHAKVNVST